MTPETSTYSTVQTASDPRIPAACRAEDSGFLRRGRDGVKADVGEEDDPGAAQDSTPPIFAKVRMGE